MSIVESTANLSIKVQIVTGLADIITLLVPKNANILYRQLLEIEIVVQIVELIFYFWMIRNFRNFSNITIFRYIDWLITTPVMLFTLMAYLGSKPTDGIRKFWLDNKEVIIQVSLLNLTMLSLGLSGELKMMPTTWSVYLGFIPFIMMFAIIYQTFVKDKQLSKLQRGLFWYFVLVWSIYGYAALQPYERKNVIYNLLDLMAKNFFGIFLIYIILSSRS